MPYNNKYMYIPYDEAWDALFAFCGIDLTTYLFGDDEVVGWKQADFAAARAAAQDYLYDHEEDDGFDDSWWTLLDSDPSPVFWSAEVVAYN